MTSSQPPIQSTSAPEPENETVAKKATGSQAIAKKSIPKKAAAKKAAVAATPVVKASKSGDKPAAASSVAPLPATKVKHKLVRDSFTIPKPEYAVLEGLKLRAANLKRPVKKGELLRAGIAALQAMSDSAFLKILATVPSLKTGRPKGPAQGASAAAE